MFPEDDPFWWQLSRSRDRSATNLDEANEIVQIEETKETSESIWYAPTNPRELNIDLVRIFSQDIRKEVRTILDDWLNHLELNWMSIDKLKQAKNFFQSELDKVRWSDEKCYLIRLGLVSIVEALARAIGDQQNEKDEDLRANETALLDLMDICEHLPCIPFPPPPSWFRW